MPANYERSRRQHRYSAVRLRIDGFGGTRRSVLVSADDWRRRYQWQRKPVKRSCWNAAKSLCLFGVVARNLDLIGEFGAKSHGSFGPSLSECLLQFVQKHCLINFGKLL